MLSSSDIAALWLTLELASLTTAILLLIGTPLAWWLTRTRWRFKFVVEALVALPLVLPPTVLGFYLLITLSPGGVIGGTLNTLGLPALSFTFAGLVVGSVIYSLPFVVQPLQHAFTHIGSRPLEVAATLGASPLDRFFSVVLPLARRGYITGAVLGFAHTLGEFGVVLMIGGNIPGKTQLASMAIYDHVEAVEYAQAHWLSACLLLLSLALLIGVYAMNRRFDVMRAR
ncbi:molybdate ABC transporter permease subunit [Cellvibrio sp. PSBB006]|uniref:molybdate ABC transporter permease subunit n=1 Tax=Cellvibrio sp. PSBB006 TaxID=1987723 RepID=UPI000B3B2F16|nr:molybdate ABC transporter permease subunit [Cellvibrio sp. PSBB006]ARU27718.1 molybdenum ABC transporter permease subunit [Cellvibrio sp. PSBB006]